MIAALAYEPAQADAWEELVGRAPMATFLHTRRFLGYHGDRLRDSSMTVWDRRRMVAVLPAALDPEDEQRVVSHPGATYGGVVHDGSLTGERCLAAMTAVGDAYRERGLTSLTYKPVPWIYHRGPADDDIYALSRLGATRSRLDLSCAIELAHRRMPRQRRQRGRRKALEHGVRLSDELELLPQFWRVVERSLATRYGARPVHTVEEMVRLRELFPDRVRLAFGVLDGAVVAGTVLFASPAVMHIQYMATDERGREVCALDTVLEHCIAQADAAGQRFFDFGTSTANGSSELNRGLYAFKREFGGGGVGYETYELVL